MELSASAFQYAGSLNPIPPVMQSPRHSAADDIPFSCMESAFDGTAKPLRCGMGRLPIMEAYAIPLTDSYSNWRS